MQAMRACLRIPVPLLAACLCAVALLGCEEDITAVTGSDFPYEVYGLLNPTADTQKVRVFPIESRLTPSRGEPVDAVVTSTDLESGEILTWRDSLVAYNDSTFGYLFWARFRPAGGHTYRIDATRSDGARSSAEVTVPRPPEILPPVTASDIALPVLFGAEAAELRSMEVEYQIMFGCRPQDITSYTFQYDGAERPPGNPQQVEVPLSEDFQTMKFDLAFKGQFDAEFSFYPSRIYLRMIVTDAGWTAPGGVFDPEVLIEPGTMSNVENGFGFVGSGYSVELRLEPPDEALGAAGFRTEEPSPDLPPCRPSVPPGGPSPVPEPPSWATR